MGGQCLQYQTLDGRIVYWIALAQDNDSSRAAVNKVENLRVQK